MNVLVTTSKTFEKECAKTSSSIITSTEHQTIDHQINASHQSQTVNPPSLLRNSATHDQAQVSAKPTSSSHRPKVRFNLDINYEKEREWHRFSSKISDASKTPIEWTQEEVV